MSTERAQAIEQAASEWLIRRDSDGWMAADEARLREWLNASSLHRVAFWRLEMAWDEAARLKALGAGIASDQPPPRGEWNVSPFFEPRDQKASRDEESVMGEANVSSEVREGDAGIAAVGHKSATKAFAGRAAKATKHPGLRITALATAASLCLVLGGGTRLWLKASTDHYITPIGGIASVPLQDGSNITLNTATEVRIDLNLKERDVDLDYGEAFFQVAKDAKRPFVVNAGKKRVTAVGTQFSVLRNGDDIRVIVSEGTVRIEDRGSHSGAASVQPETPPFAAAGSADAISLSAGSIAHAGESGVLVQQVSLSETQDQLSWRTGILMFRDQPLAQVAAEFNRYNERKIVIADPKVADLRIEGNFRVTNVDAFVRLLENGFPVRVREDKHEIVLSSD